MNSLVSLLLMCEWNRMTCWRVFIKAADLKHWVNSEVTQNKMSR